jgi:glutamyl-tRNA synthetase
MTIITRFAPSPTGYLHVGNIRTALVNYLFAKSKGGKFMLRMDDTDLVRSKPEYAMGIEEDLRWLGMEWDIFARQSDRLARYAEVKQQLIAKGRLYPCYESQEELTIKRKMQMSRGVPPIYDRVALTLTDAQKEKLAAEGRQPHYRFKLNDAEIRWHDEIRGDTVFHGKNLSDPILIREDGSMTYILTSVVDDIDFAISHVIRGEDHVSNTAIQVQIFEAIGTYLPQFGHLALIKTKEAEISKRTGGFDIRGLREEGVEPMAINSLLAKLGTSDTPEIRSTLDELVKEFDLGKFGRAPANYDETDLLRLNHKYLGGLSFAEIQPRLQAMGLGEADEAFWLSVRPNISRLSDLHDWWNICMQPISPVTEEVEFLAISSELLPEGEWTEATWGQWTATIRDVTGKSGKQLFMPLRKALTGREHGPELKLLLPLIGRKKTIERLCGKV